MFTELVKRILYALVIFIAPYQNLFLFPIIKFMSSFRTDLVVCLQRFNFGKVSTS